MIYGVTADGTRTTLAPGRGADVAWIDLVDASGPERAAVAALTGLAVPDAAALSEVETSSRLNVAGAVLTLSMPMAYRGADAQSRVTPLGFVLTPERLLTIRFTELAVFDAFFARAAALSRGGADHGGGPAAFVALLEAIVDRLADVLEGIGGELDRISREVFRADPADTGRSQDAALRATLRAIGEKEVRLSNVRDSLLGVGRIAPFVLDSAAWLPMPLRPRLTTLRKDIQSLADYDTQLANKVQFLLDATLGFISIEQNNGIKILTVVSVVGVPPTLVASIYGMNFKWIPELQWNYGYFYGLAVIAASAVVPLLWFRRRGWI